MAAFLTACVSSYSVFWWLGMPSTSSADYGGAPARIDYAPTHRQYRFGCCCPRPRRKEVPMNLYGAGAYCRLETGCRFCSRLQRCRPPVGMAGSGAAARGVRCLPAQGNGCGFSCMILFCRWYRAVVCYESATICRRRLAEKKPYGALRTYV